MATHEPDRSTGKTTDATTSQPDPPEKRLLVVGATLPYAAIAIGLYGFRSGWAAILLYHAAALVFLWHTRNRSANSSLRGPGDGTCTPPAEGTPPGPGRPNRFSVRIALWIAGIATGLSAGPILALLWSPLGLNPIVSTFCRDLGLTGTSWAGFAVYHATVNPVVEEALWRGRLGSPGRGVRGTDLLFAGYHAVVLAPVLPPWATALAVLSIGAAAWLWRQLT
ncbi:MAG: hypothetical protein KC729_20635, partial [Candidatus Eisenbacteria bacterium]|nr:hypothetical protein [Candidatus Eisenbacteria bacterium]